MTRAELARLTTRALREMRLRPRVRAALANLRARDGARVRLVAIGKAAPEMARGAIDVLGRRLEAGLVVTTDGTDASALLSSGRRLGVDLAVLRAGHPLPDARSVSAAHACLALARAHAGGPARGTLLVLVSGGASALVCAPAPGVTLSTKRAVARALLASGADVRAMNVVRKHLSMIKGGGLARAAAPDRVVTLVASDVIGGQASDVGSGPSVPDASTIRDARRLLARYAPAHAGVPLARTLGAHELAARRVRRPQVLASPEELASVVAIALDRAGLRARVLPGSTADIDVIAAEMSELARSAPRGTAFVRAAEPGVAVPARARAGRGGRASHVAALVARDIASLESSRRVLFAAIATDGVDGTSGTGGALVDERFAVRVASRLGSDALRAAIAGFDTGTLHRAMKSALPGQPAGQNVGDVHVLVVRRM